MQDEISNKRIKIPTMVINSFGVGLLCLLVSIGIIVLFSNYYMGSGASDVVVLFALPVLAIFPIGIVLSIIAFKKTKDIRKSQVGINKILTIMIVVGLVGSLSFIISIPVAFHMGNKLTEKIEYNLKLQREKEEAEKLAYETEPSIVSQLNSYTECYMYNDGINYRSGRDAICSYLRYMYSNSWQEPQNGEQLDSQKYTPNYFFESRARSDDDVSPIGISRNASDISRNALRSNNYNYHTRYIITPHQSCQKENNDSLISVWYLDNGLYKDNTAEDEQLVCLYYDYHSDTSFVKLNQYENSSLNIYTSQFEDFYKEMLKMLKMRSSNGGYDYYVPYNNGRGDFMYDNATFINDFFSDLVDTL